METRWLVFVISLVSSAHGWSDNRQRKFKDGFLFGAATSAYQVEGGWDADELWDQLRSDSDVTTRVSKFILNNSRSKACAIVGALTGHYATGTMMHKMKLTLDLSCRACGEEEETMERKGESIWDRYLHENPTITADGTNGDEASDSYHQYERDVEMLRELGVDFYRFSISWPRVLPNGLSNEINEAGLQYYDNLIDELLKYKIEPMITLYHFDLPQKLQDLGGWTNPLSVEWFEDYARVVFKRYASKVKYWVTINQPSICMDSYGDKMAPAINSRGIGDYMCVKNIMLAHAKAYRLYEKEFKKKYKGSVGISISINWIEAVDNKTANVDAAEEFRQFYFGLFTNPIWSKDGDFPKVVRNVVAKKSKEEGYERSRLPKLSSEEIKLLKGSADFLGLNHYTTFLIKKGDGDADLLYNFADTQVEISQGDKWKQARSPWLKSAPYGLYKACLYLNKQYDYPPIFITENGWSSERGLRDESRVEQMSGYLAALLYALEDGTDVKGYTAWSLMDNAEWLAGFSERFGLYEVDFDSADKKRTARLSALFYKNVIEKRIVDEKWASKSLNIKISGRKTRKSKSREEL